MLQTLHTFHSEKLVTPGQLSAVGVPINLNIFSNWSSFVFPGNKGLPLPIYRKMAIINFELHSSFLLCTSAIIQPVDHKSMEVV